jgi:hypothetical protein
VTCPLWGRVQVEVFWISCAGAPSATRGKTCRRCPATCGHSAGSRSCACSYGSGNSWRRRPGRPSGWPGPRSCCRSGCSYMCSCCISASHRRAAAGSRPSRAGCRRYCSGSSRCAIGSQLVSVSVAFDDGGVVGQGRSEGLCLSKKCIPSSKAFPSSRIWTAVSNGRQTLLDYDIPPRTPCTDIRHRPGRWATLGTLLASPWCRRAQCRCRGEAATGVATEPRMGRRRRVRGRGLRHGGRCAASSVGSRQWAQTCGKVVFAMASCATSRKTPTDRHGRQRQTQAQAQTRRAVKKFGSGRPSVRAERAPNLQLQRPSVPSRRLVVRWANRSRGRGLARVRRPSPTAEGHGRQRTHTP